jgi:hypothetical protein
MISATPAISGHWNVFDGHLKMVEHRIAPEKLEIARHGLKAKILTLAGQSWACFRVWKLAIQKLNSAQNVGPWTPEAVNYAY